MKKYIPQEIEKKWQGQWEKEKLYSFDEKSSKHKYYTLVELPYPSGDLHTGHWFTFATPDALSRFKRMSGFNVFFPHGYDAFGLPAENAAIKRGIHPKDWTMKNIETMTQQFKNMGSMMNWDYLTITCLPEYFKWNQWIFIEMFKKGLAYRGKVLSNWCETDQTVLANEGVENGKCWRCGNPVVQKEVEQWFLKITAYADELIWDKQTVDWPESVRVGQNNWIGKSEGVLLKFQIENGESSIKDKLIEVFTTALDTVFGVSFIVLAPEHPVVQSVVGATHESPEKKQVRKYLDAVKLKTEEQRKIDAKDKTGVFTGLYAINPFNNERVPIWVADYVLMNYGTGAVMGVPGHDSRDYAFAKKFNLEIKKVVQPKNLDKKITNGDFWDYKDIKNNKDKAVLFNSGEFDGLTSEEAKRKMEQYIESKNLGKHTNIYNIHDWSISRQRYWGTPVPMIHCKTCGIVPVPEKDLPIELPYDVDFTPKGKAPLASNEEWMKVKCPQCGEDAQRDPETLDTFFDSSWYFYRYVSPHYAEGPFDREKVKKLLPVDIYFGGAEHTLGHTLYARFFTKFFRDLGLVDFDEFALKRVQHGIVLGPDGYKMSKSKGNVVNPDDVVKEFGADTTRLYLCFMMPYDGTSAWSTETIAGVYRFVNRFWGLQEKVNDTAEVSAKDRYEMNRTVQKVTRDLEEIKGNTAIAAIMEWLNYVSRKENISKEEYRTFILLLAPFAPHITEEIWREFLGETESIHLAQWPTVDEKALVAAEVTIPVQVNGKVRSLITVSADEAEEATVVAKAIADEKVKKFIEGKKYEVKYVKGRILNLVVKE